MPKILFATDFSEGSAAAERMAVELAQKLDASITVFHAYQFPAYAYPNGVFYAPTPELMEDIKRGVHQSLNSTEQRIRDQRVPAQSVSREGAPHEEIVRAAEQGNYDLVILGTHGRTGLKHLWLGSVAEKVVLQCRRPVLTVRNADHAAAKTPAHT
jgi:nucleotide-binding universal stress UspA family protein